MTHVLNVCPCLQLLQQLAASSSGTSQSGSSELILPSPSEPASSSDTKGSTSPVEEVILDWKGEPMILNPGDKLPFKFF